MRKNKPLFRPLKVPWMVSPSLPDLRLLCREDDHDVVEIACQVYLGQHRENYEATVAIIFSGGGWARMQRAHSDQEVFEEDTFDWSEVWSRDRHNFEQDQINFHEAWKLHEICPSPRAYEVIASPWIEAFAVSKRHFLIAGHDAYAEVLAANWSWEYI